MTLMSACEIRTPIPTALWHMKATSEHACQAVLDQAGQRFFLSQTAMPKFNVCNISRRIRCDKVT